MRWINRLSGNLGTEQKATIAKITAREFMRTAAATQKPLTESAATLLGNQLATALDNAVCTTLIQYPTDFVTFAQQIACIANAFTELDPATQGSFLADLGTLGCTFNFITSAPGLVDKWGAGVAAALANCNPAVTADPAYQSKAAFDAAGITPGAAASPVNPGGGGNQAAVCPTGQVLDASGKCVPQPVYVPVPQPKTATSSDSSGGLFIALGLAVLVGAVVMFGGKAAA